MLRINAIQFNHFCYIFLSIALMKIKTFLSIIQLQTANRTLLNDEKLCSLNIYFNFCCWNAVWRSFYTLKIRSKFTLYVFVNQRVRNILNHSSLNSQLPKNLFFHRSIVSSIDPFHCQISSLNFCNITLYFERNREYSSNLYR